MSSDKELASLLPPSLAQGFKRLSVDEPERGRVGYGFAQESVGGPVDITGAPNLWTIPSLQKIPRGTVRRWKPAPTTVVIDCPTPPTALVGEPYIRDGRALQLDAGSERFVLLFRLPSEDVILDVLPGGEIHEWSRPRGGEAPFALPPLPPRSTLALPPFDPAALCELGLPPWLLDRARRLADAEPRGPALAVGLVLRLGRPSRTARRAELDRLRAGQEPTTRSWARKWLDAANQGVRAELEASVRESASALLETLERVGQDPVGELDRAVALDLVGTRDELESGRRLLALAKEDAHLDAVLEAVDRRALELGAALADALDVDGLDPDWRDAVSWQEPEAWWARTGPA